MYQQAMTKKETGDETQFPTKIGAKTTVVCVLHFVEFHFNLNI
jgi:hypothetical protein